MWVHQGCTWRSEYFWDVGPQRIWSELVSNFLISLNYSFRTSSSWAANSCQWLIDYWHTSWRLFKEYNKCVFLGLHETLESTVPLDVCLSTVKLLMSEDRSHYLKKFPRKQIYAHFLNMIPETHTVKLRIISVLIFSEKCWHLSIWNVCVSTLSRPLTWDQHLSSTSSFCCRKGRSFWQNRK